MTPDELKSIPKGEFIVMKTGAHPMRTRLRLFLEWGITFGKPYRVPERMDRTVACAGRKELIRAIWADQERRERQEMRAVRQSSYNTEEKRT